MKQFLKHVAIGTAGGVGSALGTVAGIAVGIVAGTVTGGILGYKLGESSAENWVKSKLEPAPVLVEPPAPKRSRKVQAA